MIGDRLIGSPPVRRPSRFGIVLLLDPEPHVGDGELQMLAESVRAWAETACAPVVDGGNRHMQRDLLVGMTGFGHAATPLVTPP